jgi:hypothetical protein
MYKLRRTTCTELLATLVMLAACGSVARDASVPVPRSEAAQRVSPVVSGAAVKAAVSGVSDAVPTGASNRESPEMASPICDSIASRWQMAPHVEVTRAESTFTPFTKSTPVAACHVSMVAPAGVRADIWHRASYWGDSLASDKAGGGWIVISHWDADGPDGFARTLVRRGVRCHIQYEQDGGDDSDSTYVPSPREAERTSCWSDPAGIAPADTGESLGMLRGLSSRARMDPRSTDGGREFLTLPSARNGSCQ